MNWETDLFHLQVRPLSLEPGHGWYQFGDS